MVRTKAAKTREQRRNGGHRPRPPRTQPAQPTPPPTLSPTQAHDDALRRAHRKARFERPVSPPPPKRPRAWPGGPTTSNKVDATRRYLAHLSRGTASGPVSQRGPAARAASAAAAVSLTASLMALAFVTSITPVGAQRWQLQSPTAPWFDSAALIRSPTAPTYLMRSAFSGAGLFDFGFVLAGGRVVWAAEPDPAACKVYSDLIGVQPHPDIRTQSLCPHYDYHMLVAGFPCTPFSVGGSQRGFDDPLTRELFGSLGTRIEKEKPWLVCLENVEGLLTSNGGSDLEFILSYLHKVGYSAKISLTDARNWGYPFLRSRIFIVALRLELAAKINWGDYQVPTVPLTGPVKSFPCFHDVLCPRDHDPYTDGAVRLSFDSVCWTKGPEGSLLRDCTPAHDRRSPAQVIKLGTCPGRSYASRLVLSSRGALTCLLTSGMPFVHIQCRNENLLRPGGPNAFLYRTPSLTSPSSWPGQCSSTWPRPSVSRAAFSSTRLLKLPCRQSSPPNPARWYGHPRRTG